MEVLLFKGIFVVIRLVELGGLNLSRARHMELRMLLMLWLRMVGCLFRLEQLDDGKLLLLILVLLQEVVRLGHEECRVVGLEDEVGIIIWESLFQKLSNSPLDCPATVPVAS